jgi:hypothetical protein
MSNIHTYTYKKQTWANQDKTCHFYVEFRINHYLHTQFQNFDIASSLGSLIDMAKRVLDPAAMSTMSAEHG